MKLIAIGGGGFTDATFPELDDFCLSQTGGTRARIAYIGTASDDDPLRIERFKTRFADAAQTTSHLPRSMPAAELASRLTDIDLIYVGGGDTERMVDTWRRNGWDLVLGEAYRSGIVLAGVSAGAVCWFETFLFSSGKGPMRPLRGLGLIPMGACPHYSTETNRRAALHAAVAAQTMPSTIAIDDGVAVAFENGRPAGICRAVAGAGAYEISKSASGVTEVSLSLE